MSRLLLAAAFSLVSSLAYAHHWFDNPQEMPPPFVHTVSSGIACDTEALMISELGNPSSTPIKGCFKVEIPTQVTMKPVRWITIEPVRGERFKILLATAEDSRGVLKWMFLDYLKEGVEL